MTADELSERYALVKKLKSELKNEEMALVLLKKLKQSQTIQREATTVGGGATLTPANKTGSKEKAMFSNKNSDHAMAKELVSNTFTSDLQVVDSCLSEQHAVEVFDGRVDEQLVERELAGRGGHRRASPLPDERELLAAAAEAEGVAETKARAGDEGKPSTTTSRRQARSQETAGEDPVAGGERDPSHNHPCHHCSNLADPTTKTAAAGNAFHPEPGEHGVHLLDRPGGVRQQDPEPGRGASGHAHPLLLQPVRHRLHPHLEVGQGCQG